MPPKLTPIRRAALRTLLIVGEGDTEKTFLDYLKRLYVTRGCGVSVKTHNAHGKGPVHIVEEAVKQARVADYDMVAVLMDTDVPWTDEVYKKAQKRHVCLVGTSPCIDGLLLKILDQNVPTQSKHCKALLNEYLGCKPLKPEAYMAAFTKPLLDEKRQQIPTLDKLLSLMAGDLPVSD